MIPWKNTSDICLFLIWKNNLPEIYYLLRRGWITIANLKNGFSIKYFYHIEVIFRIRMEEIPDKLVTFIKHFQYIWNMV